MSGCVLINCLNITIVIGNIFSFENKKCTIKKVLKDTMLKMNILKNILKKLLVSILLIIALKN